MLRQMVVMRPKGPDLVSLRGVRDIACMQLIRQLEQHKQLQHGLEVLDMQ